MSGRGAVAVASSPLRSLRSPFGASQSLGEFGGVAGTVEAPHFKFCDDIRRSARSGPANIAEGFWRGRGRPRDNAKFVRHALGSLGEPQNHLRDAFVEKYIDENEYKGIVALNRRALQATEGWHDYVMSCAERH